MIPFPSLCFPTAPLDLKKSADKILVKCLVRKKWIVLTPEEWVRQHTLFFLHKELKIPIGFFSVEKTFEYNKLKKRWDILVYSSAHKPLLLMECKSTDIAISKETLFQVLTYQHIVKGTYFGMTNGLSQYYYEVINDNKPEIVLLSNLPEWV